MEITYFGYAIYSKSRNYIYVGIFNNVQRRIKEHNLGYNKTTKPYRPFILLYHEKLGSREEARKGTLEVGNYTKITKRRMHLTIHYNYNEMPQKYKIASHLKIKFLEKAQSLKSNSANFQPKHLSPVDEEHLRER